MESLYQASLQVSQSGCFGCGQQEVAWNPLSQTDSADGVGRRLHSAPGLGLSKTPTAEMEHSLHEAYTVSASQVAPCRGPSRECGEDDQYGAKNFRHISRSLSGTVVSEREEVPVFSHGFDSPSMGKKLWKPGIFVPAPLPSLSSMTLLYFSLVPNSTHHSFCPQMS